jgi:flagellar biosynthetic protein FliR
MDISLEQWLVWMEGYFWPFVRISSMIMLVPLFGGNNVPLRIRLFFVLALTLVIAPMVASPPIVDPFSGLFFSILLQQMTIGMVMGFMLAIIFQAFTLAGQMIANAMGLGFASMADPVNGVSVPVVAQIYSVVVILLFLSLNGHFWLIKLLVDSFSYWPVSGQLFSAASWQAMANWGGWMFATGILVALPTVTAVLLVNIAFGMVVRSAPTLNIFAVGFPVTLLVGLVVMTYSLPVIYEQLVQVMELGVRAITDLRLEGAANGQ